jgi:hypothetical protein
MELLESGANKKMFRSADDIPPMTISKAEGPMTIEMMEAVDPSIVKKLLRTQELGLYEETPEILKAANLLERFTKKVKGKRVIDYERAEAILGVPLKGDETINDLFKIEFETRPVETMADGGRVGLFMGGPALTGQALSIYNSMKAYDFSDQEIANALAERGLYTPGGTTEETDIIASAPNIINKQTGGDGPSTPPGPTFNRDDNLGTSDYQGTGPGFFESIADYAKSGGIFGVGLKTLGNFFNKVFTPKVTTYVKQPTIDAIVKEKERQEAERQAAFEQAK